jgi:hypothetical protein
MVPDDISTIRPNGASSRGQKGGACQEGGVEIDRHDTAPVGECHVFEWFLRIDPDTVIRISQPPNARSTSCANAATASDELTPQETQSPGGLRLNMAGQPQTAESAYKPITVIRISHSPLWLQNSG